MPPACRRRTPPGRRPGSPWRGARSVDPSIRSIARTGSSARPRGASRTHAHRAGRCRHRRWSGPPARSLPRPAGEDRRSGLGCCRGRTSWPRRCVVPPCGLPLAWRRSPRGRCRCTRPGSRGCARRAPPHTRGARPASRRRCRWRRARTQPTRPPRTGSAPRAATSRPARSGAATSGALECVGRNGRGSWSGGPWTDAAPKAQESLSVIYRPTSDWWH